MIHQYPFSELAADYLRVCVGLAVTAGPVCFLPLAPALFVLLSGFACLFLCFGIQTFRRQRIRLYRSADCVEQLGTPLRVLWQDLCAMKLDYYSTRRDGRQGWMQLTISDGKHRIRVDSRLHGFRDLARHASAAACANRVPVAPACAANLAAMGVPVDGSGPVLVNG
jgi:hypothetical protein